MNYQVRSYFNDYVAPEGKIFGARTVCRITIFYCAVHKINFSTRKSMMWGHSYVKMRSSWPSGPLVPNFYILLSPHHGFSSGKNKYLLSLKINYGDARTWYRRTKHIFVSTMRYNMIEYCSTVFKIKPGLLAC